MTQTLVRRGTKNRSGQSSARRSVLTIVVTTCVFSNRWVSSSGAARHPKIMRLYDKKAPPQQLNNARPEQFDLSTLYITDDQVLLIAVEQRFKRLSVTHFAEVYLVTDSILPGYRSDEASTFFENLVRDDPDIPQPACQPDRVVAFASTAIYSSIELTSSKRLDYSMELLLTCPKQFPIGAPNTCRSTNIIPMNGPEVTTGCPSRTILSSRAAEGT